MPKHVQQAWTCLRCLCQQQKGRRHLAIAAAAVARSNQSRQPHAPPTTAHDDEDLRQIFNSTSAWHAFSKARYQAQARGNVGLFQNQYLTNPGGFEQYAEVTLEKCRRIVTRILDISTVEGYKTIAREMDRLSDILCRIIDLADFVRSTHPDYTFQLAANQAHARMFEYMNTLNTTTGLNDQLAKAMANPEVVSSWTEEEKKVAQILKKDFSQSAIHLPQQQREQFVELSSRISALGSKFVDEMRPSKPALAMESSRLKGMNPVLLRGLDQRHGHVVLPIAGMAATNAIKYVEDEATRKEIYLASRTAAKPQIELLEKFLRLRAELANLAGYSSYAQMTLEDKMARSPAAVNKFLDALSADNAPRMQKELERMRQWKMEDPKHHPASDTINPWDREYYRNRLVGRPQPSRKPDFLPAYFSLGTVMQGLSRLFSRLYGVRLVPREPLSGETWHPDVRRLDVIDENEGHIAVVYCDLFAREGKNPNPAHFTLRCSRLIPPSEIEEVASSQPPPSSKQLSPTELANDGMATSTPSSDGSVYQLPTIALICDFSPPSARSPLNNAFSSPPPTLLTLPSLLTLFHEMGHAIHSVLGRTNLQNVAGTRCATDFAELPSVLMERFALDPSVLALFARHWETDAPLPYDMVKSWMDADKGARAGDTETQVVLAAADQVFHGEGILDSHDFDSTRLWHEVSQKWSSTPEAKGTRWQGFFGHLVGYGGSYYSYLFDRAIAGRVWEGVFRGGKDGGAVDRESGERFKREVLRWGGSRDGWKCVGGVLGDERLAEGGEEAMEMVGRWGVKE